MRKLPLPTYQDKDITTELANNKKLARTSYPHLLNKLNLILSQYIYYHDNHGNALNITSQKIPEKLKNGLIKNYNNPPKELEYLEELRDSSPDSCPMCGSSHSASLDHLLPKEDYPEWTIFSQNLVPACECNTKRGQTLIGDRVNNERILHPYFDVILQKRNIHCHIRPEDGYKIVNIRLECINHGIEFNAVKFHLQEVVIKAGIINWLEKQWVKIYQEPVRIIQTLDEDKLIDNMKELDILLEKLLNRLDKRHQSKNNWESILIYGILKDSDVKKFIMDRHNDIVNGIVIPEDE